MFYLFTDEFAINLDHIARIEKCVQDVAEDDNRKVTRWFSILFIPITDYKHEYEIFFSTKDDRDKFYDLMPGVLCQGMGYRMTESNGLKSGGLMRCEVRTKGDVSGY